MKHMRALVLLLSFAVPFVAHAQMLQHGAKIVGTGAVGSPLQGIAVALSADGSTAIVGGDNDNSGVGAAWVFTRRGGAWTQQGNKISGAFTIGGANQGRAVALSADGNTALIGGLSDNGGIGAAWVFARQGQVWVEQGGKLVGSGYSGFPGQGYAVALSGDGLTAIVGGQFDSGSVGAAWIFTDVAGVWTQQGRKLVGSDAIGSSQQGASVAISGDGNTVIVGGPLDSNTGAAWIFTRTQGVWTQQGSKLVGAGVVVSAVQGVGVSLSTDGNTALIGGDIDSLGVGAAWVFTRTGGVWTQQGRKLVGTGGVGTPAQGRSVSLSGDGNTALIGGFGDDGGTGAAWVFKRNKGVWTQKGNKLVGSGFQGASSQGIAVSVSSDGNRAIVGGYGDLSTGAAWMFIDAQPSIASVKDVALDQGGTVAINWNKSLGDDIPSSLVTEYWVWRGLPGGSISQPADLLSREQYAEKLGSHTLNADAYMMDLSGNSPLAGSVYWQFVGTVPSMNLAGYSIAAPTLADSTPLGVPWRYFFVTARTADPSIFWNSPVDSGYSVDNIPPGTPAGAGLALLAGGRVSLQWSPDGSDPDFGYYAVYRSTTSGFQVSALTRLKTVADTSAVDSSASAGQTYFYRITTVDVHGNESIPTAELSTTVSTVQSPSENSLPAEFGLSQNYPNPFNPTTNIRFALPARSYVSLNVYNTLGQVVARLVSGEFEAGYHDVRFDAGGLASGVYLYRIQAGSFEEAKKLLVLR